MLLLKLWTVKVILSILFLNITCEGLLIDYKSMGQSVVKFVKHRNQPTIVNLLLECWKKEEINRFRKDLSIQNIPSGTTLHYSTLKHQQDMFEQMELFVLDYDCYNSTDIFYQNEKLLQFPYRWFIFIENLTTFPPLSLPLNTRVYLLQKQAPHILTSPYSILNLSKTKNQYNYLSTWSNNQTYTHPPNDIHDYQNRSNQFGLTLNTTMVLVYNRTLDHLEDGRFLLEDSLTKHNYPLLLYVMDLMNSTLNIKWVPGWGTKQPQSHDYNMMWGDLQTGASEIGGTSGFITEDRLEFADFIACPTPTLVVFILKAPPLSVVANILTKPFEWHVWACLAALILLIYFVTWITVKLEWKLLNKQELTNDKPVLREGLLDVAQFEIGALCQQGMESSPRSLAGNVITFCVYLSFFFIYTSYSACIVALLQSTSNSVTSIEDLVNTNIKLGAENAPYMKFFFLMQRGKIKETLYNQKIAPPNQAEHFLPVALGVELMRTEFYAFHAERDTIYKQISKTYTDHEKCGLVEIKFLSEIEPYMVIKKRLPYKEIITMAYCKFKENGIAKRLEGKIYTQRPKCNRSLGNFRSVSLTDAYFVGVCFGIGVCSSLIILVIERIVKNTHWQSALIW